MTSCQLRMLSSSPAVLLLVLLMMMLMMSPFTMGLKDKERLRFRQDGTFKVSIFTDLHFGENSEGPWGPEQDRNSTLAMNTLLTSEDPDLVVFLGDLITGENIVDNATAYWAMMLQPCVELGYHWATVFGNHDGISPGIRGTREDLLEVDMSFDLSYTEHGPTDIHGIGNYYLPIYPHTSHPEELPVAVLYMFDSGGETDEPYLIWEDQVEWYVSASNSFRTPDGGPRPSFGFFHIPLYQHRSVYDPTTCFGMREDGASGQFRDAGLLDAFEKQGDVKAVFSGHFHGNDFCCPLQGVQLCFGRRTGYGGYGTWLQGTRVLTLREDDPWNYKLHVKLENGEVLP